MTATRSRADTLDAAAASSLGRIMLTSLTRIGDFAERPVEVKEIPRHAWSTGDYVIGEVLGSGSVPYEIEAPNGRAVEVAPGDLVLGALGRRAATLQIVGDWRAVRSGRLETLSRAGVLGRCTSVARPAPPIADLAYRGHASRDGETISPELQDFRCPEWSHLTSEDASEFTRRLMPILENVFRQLEDHSG
jgi:hypothetical protein